MKSGRISPFLFVALGVSLGLLGFFLLLANPFGWQLSIPSLTKLTKNNDKAIPKGLSQAPTPYLFLPHGKQTYNAQGGNGTATVTSITYDPLDPSSNSPQTIQASIESRESIKSVNLTLITDTQTRIYPMTLKSGTLMKGIWTSTHTITDTYEKIYNVSFEIITNTGKKTAQPMLIR